MTGYIASTRASYYLTTLLLQVVLTEWSYIVPQVRCKAICLYFDRECEFLQGTCNGAAFNNALPVQKPLRNFQCNEYYFDSLLVMCS